LTSLFYKSGEAEDKIIFLNKTLQSRSQTRVEIKAYSKFCPIKGLTLLFSILNRIREKKIVIIRYNIEQNGSSVNLVLRQSGAKGFDLRLAFPYIFWTFYFSFCYKVTSADLITRKTTQKPKEYVTE